MCETMFMAVFTRAHTCTHAHTHTLSCVHTYTHLPAQNSMMARAMAHPGTAKPMVQLTESCSEPELFKGKESDIKA